MRKITTCSLLILFLSCLLVCGCIKVANTYTREKIAESIVSLCEKEYKIPVKAWLVGETIWIYVPLPGMFTRELVFDKKQLEKVNKVMVSASRVLLSMRPRPQFMVIVSSDTLETGLDYIIITCVPDILKLQNQFISRDEFLRRNVIKLENTHLAFGDTEGKHLEKKDFTLEYFVAEQINQRIQQHFTVEPQLKDKFKIEKVLARFNGDILRVSYNIQSKETKPPADVLREIKKIIAYVVSAYDMKNLLAVKIDNTATKEDFLVSRVELRELLK